MPRITVALATMLSFMAFTPVAAQDLQKGVDAFNSGDFATALQELRPLAEQGDAEAQFNLGVMYYEGRGILQNFAEAFKWFRLAAEQGYAEAQTYLGIVYQTGKVVPQDYASVVKWWRLAAEQGYAEAQSMLGVLYATGNGVLQDHEMAHMWYNLAATNGFEKVGKWRDDLAKQMTPASIEKAQAMARECMDSGYTKCGD